MVYDLFLMGSYLYCYHDRHLSSPGTASTQSHLPRITDVVVTGNKEATVTFAVTDSIKPLISSLQLIYGQALDSDSAMTLTLPSIGTSETIVVSQLSQVNSINYQFKLRTVIGLYTYESNVAQLHTSTEPVTSATSSATTDITTAAVMATTEPEITMTTAAEEISTTEGTTLTGELTTSAEGTTMEMSTTEGTTVTGESTTTAEGTTTAEDAVTTEDAETTSPVLLPTTPPPSILPAPMITQVLVPSGTRSILVMWSKLDEASGYAVLYHDKSGNLVGVKTVSVCS